jgi:hypothetical protein
MQDFEQIIEEAFENRAQGLDDNPELRAAVTHAIDLLDSGKARVAEPRSDGWHVNQWLKKAVLLSFALADNKVIESGHTRFYDKVPTKYADYTADQFAADGVRVVPDAVVRRGAYVAPDVVLMPSFINIGAYVDSSTMVDTWAQLRPDRQERTPFRWCRNWRGAGTHPGRSDDHRRRLLYRGPVGGGRGRCRGARLGNFDGGLPGPKHSNLRSANRRNQLWPNSGRFCRCPWQPARG